MRGLRLEQKEIFVPERTEEQVGATFGCDWDSEFRTYSSEGSVFACTERLTRHHSDFEMRSQCQLPNGPGRDTQCSLRTLSAWAQGKRAVET